MLWLLLALASLLPVVAPQPAYAWDFTQVPPIFGGMDADGEIDVCPGIGLTRRIIPCVRDTILSATGYFLEPFTSYIATDIATACLLAVLLWGTLMATGKVTAPLRDMIGLCVKIGIIYLYGSNFGIYFGWMLDALDDLLGIVAGYALYSDALVCPQISDPPVFALWNRVDCSIETLVGGVYSPFTLTAGITGFFVACFFSQSVGFFIAMLGFYMIVHVLFAIARALYIYISAYIALSLMFIVSPIFVTLALFEATRQYFEKWFRLCMSFALQPIILFAYMSMLLAAFDTVIYTAPNSIAHALAGPYANTPGFQIGTFLAGSPAYAKKPIAESGFKIDSGKIEREIGSVTKLRTGAVGDIGETMQAGADAWRNGIFEFMGIGSGGKDNLRFFKLDLPVNGVDWEALASFTGAGDMTTYIINLFIAFVMAVITVYIFWTLLEYLPYIGGGVGGKPVGMSPLGTGKLSPPGTQMMESFKRKITGGMHMP